MAPTAIVSEMDLESMEDLPGASTELMMYFREADRDCPANQGSNALEKRARIRALGCLSKMLEAMTGSQECWFQAALLLDGSSSCVNLAKLPLTCIAIARILVKFEFGGEKRSSWRRFVHENGAALKHARDFAGWVDMTFDCKTIEITHRAVCEQEAEVLRTLNWEVDGPCIEQWLYIYSVRFEKLTDITKMRRHPDLKMLRAFVLISARAILMSESFAPMLSQGDLALGLFCLSLMLDGYLPLTSLKPEEVDEADWCESMSILNAGNQPGGEAAEDGASSKASSQILEILCLAVQEDKKGMCEKVHHVVRELLKED